MAAKTQKGTFGFKSSVPRRAFAGQAAMEYLVTYGWAILMLLIVLTYLIATGAFSSGSFVVQECVIQPDLPCSPSALSKNSTDTVLRFSITNGLGFPVNFTSIAYTTFNIGKAGKNTQKDRLDLNLIESGTKINFTKVFRGEVQPNLRDYRTIYFELEYYNCKGYPNAPCSGPYVTSGRISALVQKEPE